MNNLGYLHVVEQIYKEICDTYTFHALFDLIPELIVL